MQQLYTPKQLAERAQVPLATVYRWNSEGTGPKRIKYGRHIRYRISDIEAWEQENQLEPTD